MKAEVVNREERKGSSRVVTLTWEVWKTSGGSGVEGADRAKGREQWERNPHGMGRGEKRGAVGRSQEQHSAPKRAEADFQVKCHVMIV